MTGSGGQATGTRGSLGGLGGWVLVQLDPTGRLKVGTGRSYFASGERGAVTFKIFLSK